mmetsp:Transcript_28910/g.41312  ORF Transcript_28910/g.41312 Transcript_28910/m.41312 type:complete len:248 (+) Transcript_28910:62-805(+)|eukprot:CAMPEP_0201688738 /NCGR_PEP_ID=MMETSP0578-20130828/2463_1 /ASSEMBLY_ACC=CAM_ASM_000663 /TAXON_ID=267565 /ORGANISM="Skeletonema grethea, Strain CCMP 1804" /LENGTH=247 /DNA_ID=CAMNT_0048173177 /DNA_START=50 /DNA_END=793 /DNA_ORIENTATION=-
MKISCVAPILLAGCVTAFAPSASRSKSTSLNGVAGDEIRDARSSYAKAINYQRAGGVVGNDGSAVMPQAVVVDPYGEVVETVNGHDVRGARSSYAKPTNFHFTTSQIPATEGFTESISSVQGNSIRDTVNGHDVRGARSSYATGANYHFETREIGYDGTPRRQVNAASGPYVASEYHSYSPTTFLPHSSTGAGDHSPAAPEPVYEPEPEPPVATAAEVVEALDHTPAPAAPVSTGPPKSWGIGSWKK